MIMRGVVSLLFLSMVAGLKPPSFKSMLNASETNKVIVGMGFNESKPNPTIIDNQQSAACIDIAEEGEISTYWAGTWESCVSLLAQVIEDNPDPVRCTLIAYEVRF